MGRLHICALEIMTSQEASALVPLDKIEYVDGRLATVQTNNATEEEVAITFDDVVDPKPTHFIKYWDFIRATKI
jgi:hypothetical protein